MRRATPWAALLGLALLTVAACGGSGGDDPTVLLTLDAPPVGALDGFVDNAPTAVVDDARIIVGDSIANATARGFFTFDITGLPAGVRVHSATLAIRQYDIANSPYPALGVIVIDHVNLGGTLDENDWDGGTLHFGFAQVSANPTIGPLFVDVMSQVGADGLAGRTHSSFRIRFTNLFSDNGDSDFARFQDAEDAEGSGILPRLVIQYEP